MYYLIQFFSAVLPVQRRWLQNPERRLVEIYWTLGDTCMHQASSNLEGNDKLMMLLRSPAKKTQMTCRSPILHSHYSCWIAPHLVADGFTWNRTLVMHYQSFQICSALKKLTNASWLLDNFHWIGTVALIPTKPFTANWRISSPGSSH